MLALQSHCHQLLKHFRQGDTPRQSDWMYATARPSATRPIKFPSKHMTCQTGRLLRRVCYRMMTKPPNAYNLCKEALATGAFTPNLKAPCRVEMND